MEREFEGAKCSVCPLQSVLSKNETWRPVPGEGYGSPKILIIGESPGSTEVNEERPFVGPGGAELMSGLEQVGLTRHDVRLENVISCRPPAGLLEKYLYQLSKRNGARARAGKPAIPTPMSCCSSRLDAIIDQYDNIICMGKRAVAAIRGGDPSIMTLRGTCEEITVRGKSIKVSYTIHPDFVLRKPVWRQVFRHDLGKAIRFFDGKLRWEDPDWLVIKDMLSWTLFKAALLDDDEPIAYDVETDGKNPLTAKLRCIGIGNTKRAGIIPFLSVDGRDIVIDSAVEEDCFKLLKYGHLRTVGHNAGQYDAISIQKNTGWIIDPKIDTLILARHADNELPAGLGFQASFRTDMPEAWKADHTSTEAQTDMDLWEYNAKDVVATARIIKPLIDLVRQRNQGQLITRQMELMRIGKQIQLTGIRVDEDLRFEYQSRIQERIHSEVQLLPVNPRSTTQVANLLYNKWGLAPLKYSQKTGEPSTDDETMRAIVALPIIDEHQRSVVQRIRLVRRLGKILGYLRPLIDHKDEYRASNACHPGLLVRGRLHAAYSRLPATLRYSSSNQNMQNVPDWVPLVGLSVRDIFIPSDGFVFVAVDLDQVEARVIAEEADAERMLQVYRDGKDIHNETMPVVFGDGVWNLDGAPTKEKPKGTGTFSLTRGILKNVRYAWQYGAKVPAIHAQVTSVEDKAGNLIFGSLTLDQVRQSVRGLNRADPEIPQWWQKMMGFHRKNGYVADSLWGNRRDFKNEAKLNGIVNHPIQTKGAILTHEGMFDCCLGKNYGPIRTTEQAGDQTGLGIAGKYLKASDFGARLVNQCHDSLLFEVPRKNVEEFELFLTQCMTRKVKSGGKVIYTCESKVGIRYSEV